MFETVIKEVSAEITEKKSKFICNVFHVESKEEAEEKLAMVKKKYHDARHNCYAYKIAEGDLIKSSDDGEPSGTAGVPMLNIINGRNLSNILVVVTRYFGGILLGTGGLVRAYSQATTAALETAEIALQYIGLQASFSIEYNQLEELKYHLSQIGITISKIEYGEKIDVIVEGEEEQIKKLELGKLSDKIMLDNVRILDKKLIIINKK